MGLEEAGTPSRWLAMLDGAFPWTCSAERQGTDMSATGNPVEIVWVIRQNPQDEGSIFAMPVDERQLGVFIFTQREHADEFARSCPDMPRGTVVARVEVPELLRVLTEQAQRGCTHVVTDPILGAGRYHDEKTLTIADYITQLQG